MAICDSHLQRPALIRSLLGHNIGRMSLTADRRGVLIPHQLLDSKAETTRGGVHWGGVMLNVIRTIPIDAITAGSDRLDSRLGLDYVGIPDRAAGDPVSITLARDNLRVVLLSGVHELVTSPDGIQYYGRQAVGLGPSSLSLDDDGTRAWVTGRFADTVSLVQLAPLEVLATISLGPPAKPTSIDRGEQFPLSDPGLLFMLIAIISSSCINTHLIQTLCQPSSFLTQTVMPSSHKEQRRPQSSPSG